MIACADDANYQSRDVCGYQQKMDPEQAVEDHGGESAVECDPEARVSLTVAGKAAARVEDGCFATEPGRKNEGPY
jgi:hypothetical protein